VEGQLQTGNLGTVVPWAPVPEGSEAVARYITQLPEPAKASLRGFRYLLQDFPPVSETSDNPILSEQFIDSLSYLVKHGYSFDFTIDARRFGVEVLQNVLDCVNKVQAAQETNGPAARFIIDHLGKPDLASVVGKAVPPTALTDYERIMVGTRDCRLRHVNEAKLIFRTTRPNCPFNRASVSSIQATSRSYLPNSQQRPSGSLRVATPVRLIRRARRPLHPSCRPSWKHSVKTGSCGGVTGVSGLLCLLWGCFLRIGLIRKEDFPSSHLQNRGSQQRRFSERAR
jgi:hypothetical protein